MDPCSTGNKRFLKLVFYEGRSVLVSRYNLKKDMFIKLSCFEFMGRV